MKKYYKDAVNSLLDTNPDFEPIKQGEVPHIIGPFNNWRYQTMREIIPFCRTHDDKKPDFLKMAVEKK